MKSRDMSLHAYLKGRLRVRLPSGREKTMSRRKAAICRYAVAAANGQWEFLDLLMQIAKGDGEKLPAVIVRHAQS
jgi:hypothetical protein